MEAINISGIEKINFINISKSTTLASASFLTFGIVNAISFIGQGAKTVFSGTPLITIESVIIVIACILAAITFKGASKDYSTIACREDAGLEANAAAGQRLQKAFNWAAIVISLMLIRSIQYHGAYDLIS